MSIIQRLSDVRNAAGLTQAKLAEELGTTQQAINKYENSDSDISISKVIAIAKFFNVSIDYLMGISDIRDIAEPRCDEDVVKRIGDARMHKRLLQRDIAELLGTTQQQITRYEKGKQEITSKRFIRLAEVCEVSLDYLAGLTYNPNKL